jgi:hypothetical protein
MEKEKQAKLLGFLDDLDRHEEDGGLEEQLAGLLERLDPVLDHLVLGVAGGHEEGVFRVALELAEREGTDSRHAFLNFVELGLSS